MKITPNSPQSYSLIEKIDLTVWKKMCALPKKAKKKKRVSSLWISKKKNAVSLL